MQDFLNFRRSLRNGNVLVRDEGRVGEKKMRRIFDLDRRSSAFQSDGFEKYFDL